MFGEHYVVVRPLMIINSLTGNLSKYGISGDDVASLRSQSGLMTKVVGALLRRNGAKVKTKDMLVKRLPAGFEPPKTEAGTINGIKRQIGLLQEAIKRYGHGTEVAVARNEIASYKAMLSEVSRHYRGIKMASDPALREELTRVAGGNPSVGKYILPILARE